MSDVKDNITENIKYFRSKMNISQEELSDMCGYSSTYIGKIERGKRSPSLDTLIRIAEALQIPMASLFDPFYRCQYELKTDWNPKKFSPYDATIRRFNYLIGRLDSDGEILDIYHLPWFQSDFGDEGYSSYFFLDVPILQFSPSLRTRISSIIEKISAGDEPIHLPLKIAGFDVFDETVDLVFVPDSNDMDECDEIRFELFYPRVVHDGDVMNLSDLEFDLAE